MSAPFDAVVLSGGASSRMGGVDKTTLQVGGTTLLDRVLDACAAAVTTVVVGPARRARRPVRWARESPPGTGPLAALAAGVARLDQNSRPVVVLAADLVYVDAGVVGRLVEAAAAPYDGALISDSAGRPQPLAAAYRRDPLDRALSEIGDPRNRPMRLLLDRMLLRPVSDARAATDVDTPDDLAKIEKEFIVLNDWVQAVREALDIESEVDVQQLLDLARDVAHNVERAAAPVTTYLVGLAAAERGGTPQAVAEASRMVTNLALGWGRGGD